MWVNYPFAPPPSSADSLFLFKSNINYLTLLQLNLLSVEYPCQVLPSIPGSSTNTKSTKSKGKQGAEERNNVRATIVLVELPLIPTCSGINVSSTCGDSDNLRWRVDSSQAHCPLQVRA